MPEPEQGIAPVDDAMSLNPGSRGVLERIVLVCGAVTAGIATLILVGWAIGSDALTAMGTGYIAAPNTALLFALLGSAVLARDVWPASRGIHYAVAAAALFSAVVASVTLTGFAIGLNIDDWLFRTTRMFGAVPMGRMSPVTAFCFVLGGISLLLLEYQARTWAAILGTLITLAGVVCLMGYWFGAPLFYGGSVIPVALPTSLALVTLGVGLTAAAGPGTWPLNTLIGPSTRARLLRALLPPVILLALIADWIHAFLVGRSDPGVVLAAAMTAISFLLLVSYVVTRISRTIGDAIDRTLAERKRAEEEHARLAAIVENSNDAIIGRAIDSMVTSWNPAAERILGYKAAEVIGRNPIEIVPPELRQEAAEWRDRVKAGQTLQNMETVRITKDGRYIDIAISIAATRDNSGRIIGTGVIVRDISERKRTERILRNYAARLQAVSRKLLEVQEDERRRLARELHDQVGQVLTALKINLQVIERQPAAAPVALKIKECAQIADAALQQVRTLMLDLRPPQLDELGLAVALRTHAERMVVPASLTLHFSALAVPLKMPPAIEIVCFRITQEALTNILRHAGARNVWIALAADGDGLKLTVRDDGKGFDLAEAHRRAIAGGSIGLLSMEERAALADGRIEITTAPGAGTTVRTMFSLQAAQATVEKA